ncbi:arylamine N-acetyltransferase [Flavobacterium sp.]|uniref:arylamine N-acetyltransferase n=1 Tax=Flavobacterium sp. TaxID=239 RepID=UPI004047C8A2
MKLSNADINSFLDYLKIPHHQKKVSVEFLNSLALHIALEIPWQNLTMIASGLNTIPSLEDVKQNVLNGKGGICLDVNRFMFYFLKAVGFNVSYLLLGRNNEEKKHIALLVELDNELYFADFGDAQPYFQVIKLDDKNVLNRGNLQFRIEKKEANYYLIKSKNGIDKIQYVFDLTSYNEEDFQDIIKEYYTNIFYGPFWKSVHFAYYPSKKLKAIKGLTILNENENGEIQKTTYASRKEFELNIQNHFAAEVMERFDFITALRNLELINSKNRFGIYLDRNEFDSFIELIQIKTITLNIEFISDFIKKVLDKIPFQNYKMIERGFGCIPDENCIKEDMFSLNGGTCATMNTFIGSVLYKLGFEVYLVNGTMAMKNDHVALLLELEGTKYIIDVGDGQPYFEPFPINKEMEYEHPFRKFRAYPQNNEFKIDFFIDNQWSTDVTYHLEPKTFQEISSTIEQHYTIKEFGPFWKGIRFAMYPKQEIIAIRDTVFMVQKLKQINKIKIENEAHLDLLLDKYVPEFSSSIKKAFNQLQLL